MMLFLDGTHQGVHYKNANYRVQDYESAFELLTKLVLDNWVLESVVVVDNGDCMLLPVEAFDGTPILEPIHCLQKQWAQLLKPKTIHVSEVNKRLDKWFSQLDDYYSSLITHSERMIVFLESKKHKLLARRQGETKELLMKQYESQLERYRVMYEKTKQDRQKYQDYFQNSLE